MLLPRTREQFAAALTGLGVAVLLGLLERALATEGQAGAPGITSAALGALIALTVYRSIGRK